MADPNSGSEDSINPKRKSTRLNREADVARAIQTAGVEEHRIAGASTTSIIFAYRVPTQEIT